MLVAREVVGNEVLLGRILIPTTARPIKRRTLMDYTKSINKSDLFLKNNNNLILFLGNRKRISQMILGFSIKKFQDSKTLELLLCK